jgi:hypothetical protein
MKSIIKIFGISALILFTVSCNDFLTVVPESQQVLETYYTSDDAVIANSGTVYQHFTWLNFEKSFMWLAGNMMAGDLYYTDISASGEGHFYYLSYDATNTHLTDGWNALYRVISFCNNIINGMPTAARENGVSEEVINRAIAEARCVRAFAYYYLTEYWIDVPIVTDNNMDGADVVRHTQKSVYKFIQDDLEFAMNILPNKPFQSGRATKWTAEGMLAKVCLTAASHLNDSESAANFEKAKQYAADVINNSGLELYPDLATMFYPAGNNNPESLLAIQCMTYNYGYGTTRNAHWSRTGLVNSSSNAWGAGKGPTLSLQEAFENGDQRRYYTYMHNGDHYNNLGGGGYAYANYSADGTTENPNEMLAHLRKYVIGTDADCDGMSGGNQDAGNNVYLLRLADVYLVYVEACIGAGSSTNDALALDVFLKIRARAGLNNPVTSITYDQLIKERRVEFAFEDINWFDIKRMSYRDVNKAVDYLNGMERERALVANETNYSQDELNAANAYYGGFTSVTPDDDPAGKGSIYYLNPTVAPIVITAKDMVLPIPSETVTKTPNIMNEPVDY